MPAKTTKNVSGAPDKTDKLIEAVAGATVAIANAVARKEDLAELDFDELIERWNQKPTSEKLAAEVSRRTGGVYLAKPGTEYAAPATKHLVAHLKSNGRPYDDTTWGNFVVLRVGTRGVGTEHANPFTGTQLVALEEGTDLPDWMTESDDLAQEYVDAEVACYDGKWDVIFPVLDDAAMRKICWIAQELATAALEDQIRTGNQCADLIDALVLNQRLPRAVKKALLLFQAEAPNSPKIVAAMSRMTLISGGASSAAPFGRRG